MAGFSFKNVKTPSLRNMMKKMQKPSEEAEAEQVEAAAEQTTEATPAPVLLNYADAKEQVIAAATKSITTTSPAVATPEKAAPQAVVASPTSSSPSVSDLAGGAAATVKATAEQVTASIQEAKAGVESEVKAGVEALQAQTTQALESASSLAKGVEDEGFVLLDGAKQALSSSTSPLKAASPLKDLPASLDGILQGGAAGLSERVAVAREQAGTVTSSVASSAQDAMDKVETSLAGVREEAEKVVEEGKAVGEKVGAQVQANLASLEGSVQEVSGKADDLAEMVSGKADSLRGAVSDKADSLTGAVSEAADGVSGKADSLRSAGSQGLAGLQEQANQATQQAQADVSDALEARLAAVDLSTASITSATSVKSTTSATSANGKEVSFSGLGEEAERLVSDIDAVLDGAATKQPSVASVSPLAMDTLMRANSVSHDTPNDDQVGAEAAVSFLAAALGGSSATTSSATTSLTGGAAVQAQREAGVLSGLDEDAPPSPHPGGAEGDALSKDVMEAIQAPVESSSVEANLGAMERHVAAMLDESTTDKEATDKAASLLSTEETTGMEAFAVALEGNTDKEASLSGEQHIAQGLLSEETETEGEEREVVKSLLGSRGGATADDATADETQASSASPRGLNVPSSSSDGGLLSLPLLLGLALLGLMLLTGAVLYVLGGEGEAASKPLVLAANTPFQIRDESSGLCFSGSGFGPCSGNKASPTFTLTRVDLEGAKVGVLEVSGSKKCLHVTAKGNKRSLSLGGCGDVSKAAGWALVEGSLVHTTANAALAKKGDKAELVVGPSGGLQLHGLVAPQADDQEPITFHSFDVIAL